MPDDLVSVIIPAYNCGLYLAATLASILAQSHANTEIIVVDDASQDNTAEVVRAQGDRVTYVRLDKNCGGPAKPRNIGICQARGNYIALFDSDDLMLPGKLEEQVRFLENQPDLGLVFTNFRNFLDGKDSPDFLKDHKDFQDMPKTRVAPGCYRISAPEARQVLIGDNFIGTSGIMFRKSVLETIGGFDESLENSDDIDFLFRVTSRFDIGYIDKVLHKRRLHAQNISSRPSALQHRLRVYERLKNQPLSAPASRALAKSLSGLLFALGYDARVSGQRWAAVRYYWQSWRHNKENVLVFKSILRAFLPF